MRLIDADILKMVIIGDVALGDNSCDNSYLNAMYMCLEYIDKAPTVEERPQGKWITNYESQFFNPGRSCSLCNKTVEFSENFCPNCGADMRGNNNG